MFTLFLILGDARLLSLIGSLATLSNVVVLSPWGLKGDVWWFSLMSPRREFSFAGRVSSPLREAPDDGSFRRHTPHHSSESVERSTLPFPESGPSLGVLFFFFL